jgi:mannose-6-phosphate isomerase-like protein (cupin superfamily)
MEMKMDPDNPWGTFLDVKYGPLERFDIAELAQANTRRWYNQTLSRVNDCVVRLGVVQGEYPWHKHDDEDECFYVVEGRLLMDVEDREPVEIVERQGITVPAGTRHRPRAPQRTIILLVEGAGIAPTGD